jgi:hypothetical protein
MDNKMRLTPKEGAEEEIELMINQSESYAISTWDDDGGAVRNVIYQIIEDRPSDTPRTPTNQPPGGSSDSAEAIPSRQLETVGAK